MFLYEFFNLLPTYLSLAQRTVFPNYLDNSILISLFKEIVLKINTFLSLVQNNFLTLKLAKDNGASFSLALDHYTLSDASTIISNNN